MRSLRPVLRPVLRPALRSPFVRGSVGFAVAQLFAANEPGVHYETYNPDSLVQRRNLLTWTEDFSNAAWGKVAVTPTYNAAAAPDGSLTADLIAADGTASPHAITAVTLTTNPAQKTQSFYFKAGTGSFIQLLFDGNTGGWANFNLTNGTVSVQGTGVTAAITPDANGFYRCSVQDTLGTATGIRAAIVSGAAATRYESNTLTASVYVWGAQFELGALTAYQKVTDWNTEYLAAALDSVGMWQDAVGTPVTAVEQTVGMWLDRSRGIAASGTDALNGIGAFNSAAGWTATGGVGQSITGGQCVFTAMSAIGGYWTNGTNPLILNGFYEVSFDIVSINAGGTVTVYAGSVNAVNRTTVGTHRVRMQCAGAGDRDVRVYGQAGTTAVVDNVTFKLVGSATSAHATQATGSSRPRLSALYNLLTKTEQFNDATWVKTAVTATPDTITANGVATQHAVQQAPPTFVVGRAYRLRIEAKAGTCGVLQIYGNSSSIGANSSVNFNLVTGVIGAQNGGSFAAPSITPLGDGWYGCEATFTPIASSFSPVFMMADNDLAGNYPVSAAGLTLQLRKANLLSASDAALNQPAYQRVNTATDYDTAGFIHYLKFDGIDDSLKTAAIDFSGVNKMTVWAGLTKLSDAAVGLLVELTAQGSTTDGGFYVAAPGNAGSASYSAATRGSVAATAGSTAASFASPTTRLAVLQMDNAGATMSAQLSARIDGSASALTLSGGPTTAGNYANAALNIGRRNDASLPFNGRLTSLTVRGTTTPTSTAFIKSMEQYAAKLAGQTFAST